MSQTAVRPRGMTPPMKLERAEKAAAGVLVGLLDIRGLLDSEFRGLNSQNRTVFAPFADAHERGECCTALENIDESSSDPAPSPSWREFCTTERHVRPAPPGSWSRKQTSKLHWRKSNEIYV